MRDAEDLFAALARSRFRSRFRLGEGELRYLREKGLEAVRHHAGVLIGRRLAPAEPLNDGKQTPWRGHPVFVAQHGTATCCRSCLAKWHGIAAGRELTADEQRYVVGVIIAWVEHHAPSGALREPPVQPDLWSAPK
jgi:hypothetical protein